MADGVPGRSWESILWSALGQDAQTLVLLGLFGGAPPPKPKGPIKKKKKKKKKKNRPVLPFGPPDHLPLGHRIQ